MKTTKHTYKGQNYIFQYVPTDNIWFYGGTVYKVNKDGTTSFFGRCFVMDPDDLTAYFEYVEKTRGKN